MWKWFIAVPFLIVGLVFWLVPEEPEYQVLEPHGLALATSFPKFDQPNCKAKVTYIYDECSDQVAMFGMAQAKALEEGKTLLVINGAEWCIWCHVLHSFLKGGDGDLSYRYDAAVRENGLPYGVVEADLENPAAQELARYVAQNFVVFSMDVRQYDGPDPVLLATGAIEKDPDYIPFAFAVDRKGKFAGWMPFGYMVEDRPGHDWPHAYNRASVTRMLMRMRRAAR